MVVLATVLFIMEAIGDSLMDGATLIMDGDTPTMAGAPLIMDMVMDTVMVMDTAQDMGMLIIEEEETVAMPEEQLIEEVIDILVLEEEQDIPIVEDLILLAEAVPILEENPVGDPITVEETQLLDDREIHPIVEIIQLEGPLIITLDQALPQDLIRTEVLAEVPEAVAEATEVAEVVVLVAAAEDAAEVNT